MRCTQVKLAGLVARRVEHRGGDQVGREPQRAGVGGRKGVDVRRHHLQHADRRIGVGQRHNQHRAQPDPSAGVAIDARVGFRIAALQQFAARHAQARQAAGAAQPQAEHSGSGARCGAVDHVVAFGKLDRRAARAGELRHLLGHVGHHAAEIEPKSRDLGLDRDDAQQRVGGRGGCVDHLIQVSFPWRKRGARCRLAVRYAPRTRQRCSGRLATGRSRHPAGYPGRRFGAGSMPVVPACSNGVIFATQSPRVVFPTELSCFSLRPHESG
ncbi:hypothetical protein BLAT2472_10514 [Burkholderia latens]